MAPTIPQKVSGSFAAPPAVQGLFQTSTPRQAAASVTAKTQGSLQQYLNYLGTHMGRLANTQATQESNASTSPLLSSLNTAAKTGQDAINGYTQQFAGELGKIAPQVAGAYQTAETGESALDTAIADQLRGAGTTASADLTNTLAARGQDTSVAAQAASTGAGLAGASYAAGSASLAQLLGTGAAATANAATLPGLAALSGLQATKGLESDVATQRAKIYSDAQKVYPGLEHNAYNELLGQQRNAISEQKNETAASLAKTADQIRQQTADAGTARVGIAQQNANTSVARANIAAAQGNARISIAQQNANTSAGRLHLAQVTEAAKAGKASGGLTANETIKLVQGWNTPKSSYVRVPAVKADGSPITNSAGVPQYVTKTQTGTAVPYTEQISRLVAAGKTQTQAQSAVNAAVPQGQNGRPYEGAQAATVAQQFMAAAAAAGTGYQQALAHGRATGVIPEAALVAAAKKAYGFGTPGNPGYKSG